MNTIRDRAVAAATGREVGGVDHGADVWELFRDADTLWMRAAHLENLAGDVERRREAWRVAGQAVWDAVLALPDAEPTLLVRLAAARSGVPSDG